MSDPVLQLNDPGNWDLIYSELLTADSISATNYRPIQPFMVPIAFSSSWIAIGTSSRYARPHWFMGCRVQSVIRVPDSPFGDIIGQQVVVPLHNFGIYRFTSLDSQLRLKVLVPMWHRELGITIYEYTGAASDTTEDLIRESIDIVRVDLARIEFTVNNP